MLVGKAKMWGLAIATIFGYMNYFKICDQIFVIIPGVIVLVMQIIVFFGYGKKITKIKKVEYKRVKFKRGKELAHALFDTEYYMSTLNLSLLDKLTVDG